MESAIGPALLVLAAVVLVIISLASLAGEERPRRMTPAEEAEYDLLNWDGGKVTVYKAKGRTVAVRVDEPVTPEAVSELWS